MPGINVSLSEEENWIVSRFKADAGAPSKEKAIKDLILAFSKWKKYKRPRSHG